MTMERQDVVRLIEEALVELGHVEYGEVDEELSLDALIVDAEDRLYLISVLNLAYFICPYSYIHSANVFRFHLVRDMVNEVMYRQS